MFDALYASLMKTLDRGKEFSDEEILEMIDSLLTQGEGGTYVPLKDRTDLRNRLFNAVRRLDILQELVDTDSVTEIMVNGTEAIFIEEEGAVRRWDKTFGSADKLEDIVRQIAARCNRVANEASPILDARLENGARVNVVMPPIALNGPVVTIRRFPDHPITMRRLIEWQSVSEEAALFLRDLVKAGYNIFISGGTGSGKTTFLNALSGYIPEDERVITIEDNAELQIRSIRNLVRLEARQANEEGENEVSIRDLIRASLRMRPNRIVVGEVRGEETIDMLQAMNTGHDGSLSTGHGNSPKDMLLRLEAMIIMSAEIPVSAVRRMIASGIDILVHLARFRDRSRKVLEIDEIDGYDAASGEIRMHTLFLFEETEEGENTDGRVHGHLARRGALRCRQKLALSGLRERLGAEEALEETLKGAQPCAGGE